MFTISSRLFSQTQLFQSITLLSLTLAATKAFLILTNSVQALILIGILLLAYLIPLFATHLGIREFVLLLGTVILVNILGFPRVVTFLTDFVPKNLSLILTLGIMNLSFLI